MTLPQDLQTGHPSMTHPSVYLARLNADSQCLSEPEFYSDLVYKFKKNVDRVDFF